MKNLNKMRKKINLIDKRIKRNYLKRMKVCKNIALYKSKNGLDIDNQERENQVLDNVCSEVPICYKRYLRDLYKTIFCLSKDYQNQIINYKDKKFYLIGESLSHSYSSKIHSLLGLNYELKEIKKENIKDFILSGDYDGLNVTIPYKEKIISYLDELSKEAKEIGAVNTILKKDNKLYGFNTDIIGIDYSFKKFRINVKNKNVAILGSGGAGKTAYYYCKKNGAKKINFVSREGDINYSNCYEKLFDTDIIINATPVGSYPNVNECKIDLLKFRSVKFVFDFVYNPCKTKLLSQAEELKIKNINGLYMLVAQAIASESVWNKINCSKKAIDLVYNHIKQSDKEG